MTNGKRFTYEGLIIVDKLEDELVGYSLDNKQAEEITSKLNQLEDKNEGLTESYTKLQEDLNKSKKTILDMLKIINDKITENKQLAELHYEKDNEYIIRADELEKLKNRILDGGLNYV